MLLPWLILIPFIGGFLCWQTERFGVKVPRWIALITMGLTLALSLQLWLQGGYSLTRSAGIPQWQYNRHAVDPAFWYLYPSRH